MMDRSLSSYSISCRPQKNQTCDQNNICNNLFTTDLGDYDKQQSVFPDLPGSAVLPNMHKLSAKSTRTRSSLDSISSPFENLKYPPINILENGNYFDPCQTESPDNAQSTYSEFADFDTNVSANDEAPQDDIEGTPAVSSERTEKSPTPQSRTTLYYDRHIVDLPKPKRPCAGMKSFSSAGEPSELPKSCVYVSRSPGVLYQLEFYARNARFSPLYVNPRPQIVLGTEKKVQPIVYEYRTPSPPPAADKPAMATLYRKQYAVSPDDQIRTKPKSILPPLRVYVDEPSTSRRRAQSESSKPGSVGSVYISYEGVLLRIICKNLPITRLKMPVPEDILARMEKLKMPSSDSRKNKGVLIARCGQDLLQFSFDMEEVSFTKLELKGTAAVQTEDKMVYIREKSQITGRSLLIALPESTYFYKDPMESIHRLHVNFQGTNVVPLWKYELMRARLAERKGAASIDAKIENAFKQTRGSRLCFDGLDSIITVQGGMMCCEVFSDQAKYESLIENYSQFRMRFQSNKSVTSKSRTADEIEDDSKAGDLPETAEEPTDVNEAGAKEEEDE